MYSTTVATRLFAGQLNVAVFYTDPEFIWTNGSPLNDTSWPDAGQDASNGSRLCVGVAANGVNMADWFSMDCDQLRGFVCRAVKGALLCLTGDTINGV